MRWLFISLMLLNVAVGGWQLMVHLATDMSELPQPRSFARVLQPDSITLLKEAEQIISQGDSVFESAVALKDELERETLAARAAINPNVAAPESKKPIQKLPAEAAPVVVLPESPVIAEAELPATEVVEIAPSQPLAEPVALSNAEKTKSCQKLGPFAKRADAEKVASDLMVVATIDSLIELERLKGENSYWVYLNPLENRDAARAKLAEVKAKKIDSYIIVKGDLKEGISLGMYSNKDFAEKRVLNMKRLGLDANLRVVERSKSRYWVSFDAAVVDRDQYASLSEFLQNRSDLEIKENFCGLDVASESNIH